MKKRYNPIGEITSLSLSCILTNMIAFYFFHQIFYASIIFTFGFMGVCSLGFFYVYIRAICEDRIELFGTIYPGIVSKERSKNIVKGLKQIWIILSMGEFLVFFITSWIFYESLIKAILITISLTFTFFILILTIKYSSFIAQRSYKNVIDTTREVYQSQEGGRD